VFNKPFRYFEFLWLPGRGHTPGAKAPDKLSVQEAKAKALAYLEAKGPIRRTLSNPDLVTNYLLASIST
jgi:hypothetical protein